MVVLACAAKALLIGLVAFMAAASLSLMLLVLAGMPASLLSLLWGLSMCALAAHVAREDLESSRIWLWAVGGFFLGFFIVPVLVFAHEWDQAKQRARFLVGLPAPGGDRVGA